MCLFFRGTGGKSIPRGPKTNRRQTTGKRRRKRKHRRKRKRQGLHTESKEWEIEESEEMLSSSTSVASMDLSVVNLSEFQLNDEHIKLLKKGLSFSPKSPMNEFEVFKDISLFLRKVLFRLWHTRSADDLQTPEVNLDRDEKEAIESLYIPIRGEL